MLNDWSGVVSLLQQGEAPGNVDVLNELSVGLEPLTNFLAEHYLDGYISLGGSKIKFVTGRSGSGKTHFLQYFEAKAEAMGYITVYCSAREIWVHDFGEIYADVFKKIDMICILERCAARIIRELGSDPDQIPTTMTFADYLSGMGELDALSKKEIRNQLQEMFLKNPLIDNNFAIACGLLTGGILGHPMLEAPNRDLLLAWLSGRKDVKLAALRGLGLSPSKITKYNARHMLRSLSEVSRLAGYPGLVVAVDGLDILVRPQPLDTMRYTRLKREDAYECIRELIDEIDTLKNVFFLFAFDKSLIDDETGGLKSYQALWLRIQNEIVSERFNKFTDIIDMDKFAEQHYSKEMLLEMSQRLASLYNRFEHDAQAIDDEKAQEIMAKVRYGKLSLPRQINNATLQQAACEWAEG